MQTLSSASRTCIASASAVECTATVAMPSSLQARSTRSAISPRLAIRILSNIAGTFEASSYSMIISGSPNSTGWPSSNRICVTVPAARRRNLVHGLHRFDDQKRIAGCDLAADVDERPRAGLGGDVGGADHRRGHDAGMFREVGDGGCRGSAARHGPARMLPRTSALRVTVTLRATRTRRPSRSTSISVRLVSSSKLGELADQFAFVGGFGGWAFCLRGHAF